MMCKWEVLAVTAVIYARYSTDSQREESIEGQIRECTAYAEKNGFTVVKHYIDRAISAKTDNRSQFQEAVRHRSGLEARPLCPRSSCRMARNRSGTSASVIALGASTVPAALAVS